MSWRDELPDPLRTSDGRLVATRAELDAAQVEVIHGGSDAGRFSMMFGLMGWDVVDGERLPRLAHEARDLLTDRTGYVTGPLRAGTRAMLERIGALAIEEAHRVERASLGVSTCRTYVRRGGPNQGT